MTPPASVVIPSSVSRHSVVRDLWSRFGTFILWTLIILMAIAAVFRLHNETWRLLFGRDHNSAIDLKYRYSEVSAWFTDRPVYKLFPVAVYPPETYAALWPFIGNRSFTAARYGWAITAYVGIIWLGLLSIRIVGPPLTLPERLVLFLLPFAMYATSAALSTGQLAVHLMAFLLAGLFLLTQGNGLWRDIVGSILIVIALAKMTIALPFMWLIVFCVRSRRPLFLVPLLYLILTVFAMRFQSIPPLTLFHQLSANSGAIVYSGYGNIHSWLAMVGLVHLAAIAPPVIGLILGAWVWRYRRADIWILIGVTSIVARVWMYHRLYDDLLVLPAILALYRVARRDGDAVAGLALAIALCLALAPAGALNADNTLGVLSRLVQTLGWLGTLAFLHLRVTAKTELSDRAEDRSNASATA